MITVDFKRFIRNRCWFGFWYAYPGLYSTKTGTILKGHWRRVAKERLKWHLTPVALVWYSFPKDITDRKDHIGLWSGNYGKI